MIDVLITADYEVFGNGTGDVRRCVVDPTSEILGACDAHGARLTLFFEVLEYRAFREAGDEGARLMREQAVDAVRRGHDVQLHLHPQWVGATRGPDGWSVDLSQWRLPALTAGDPDDDRSVRGLIHGGKADLEEMLRGAAPDYGCVAFRAGAYCIQPSGVVLRALAEAGIRADSSVWPGGLQRDDLFDIDFRDAPAAPDPWRPRPDDVTSPWPDAPPETPWEIPILTRPVARWRKIRPARLLRVLRGRSGPPGCGVTRAGGGARAPRSLFERVPTRWDFCALTASEMVGFLESTRRAADPDRYLPLVMIGHPKEFGNGPAFARFLSRVTRLPAYRRGEIRFATVRDAVRRLDAGDATRRA